jgi:UDP:flavonoid glycosyltransferase YjiC (YdhE family)
MHTPEQVTRIWLKMIELGNPIRQAELVMKYGFDPATETMYAAARELCSQNEIVIGHFFVFPLRVAAEKACVPAVTLNIVHNCVPSREIPPPGIPNPGKWSYPVGWWLVRKLTSRIFLPRVNVLRRREGLKPCHDLMTQVWASDRLNLIAVSPTICRRPQDWGQQHQLCGFLNPSSGLGDEALPDGLDEFLGAGEPPVYFTFGSMMVDDLQYMKETANIWIEAVERAKCRAIIQLPWQDLSAFEAPDTVFRLRRSPYKKVFPRCAMVVHHGGAGTVQSSLLTGKPSIVVAHMADQFFWGSELERLGVAGRTLGRKDLKASRLATEIGRVLENPEMARRAAGLGATMAGEDGVGTAIGMIERTFSSG